jgi:hypothetical protein
MSTTAEDRSPGQVLWSSFGTPQGPFTGDQPAVPGQQRARRDEPADAQHGRQVPGQRRQDRAVGPVRPGPGDLTAEYRDLMTEHHDLGVLGCLAAAQQHEPAQDPDHDQVQQPNAHEPRSCRNLPLGPNRSSQHMRQVMERYRPCAARLVRRHWQATRAWMVRVKASTDGQESGKILPTTSGRWSHL